MISKTLQNFLLQSTKNIIKLGKFQKKIANFSAQISSKISSCRKILHCGMGGYSCDAQNLVPALVVSLTTKNKRTSITSNILVRDIATIHASA